MKVSLGTIEVDDYMREALAHHYGQTGMATRDQIRRFVLDNGWLVLEQDLCADYEHALELSKQSQSAEDRR
jgi:hypothetical protein